MAYRELFSKSEFSFSGCLFLTFDKWIRGRVVYQTYVIKHCFAQVKRALQNIEAKRQSL